MHWSFTGFARKLTSSFDNANWIFFCFLKAFFNLKTQNFFYRLHTYPKNLVSAKQLNVGNYQSIREVHMIVA